MKLIYISREDGEMNSGVNLKISAQVHYLSKYGIDAKTYSIIKNGNRNYLIDNKNRFLQIPGIKEFLGILGKIYREYKINRTLENLISSLDTGDIIYLRILYPSPQLSMILQKTRTCKIIIEYQTIEPLEYRLKGKYWYLLIDSLFGDALRKYTDAIVGVTDEITQYELKRSKEPDKPHFTIGNGFEVDSVPIRNTRPYNNTELHLLCVANVSKWHGLDRLLKGIATYSGNTRIIFHIAGEGAEIPLLKQLVKKLKLQNRVIFHGFKTDEDLDTLFNSCHIAVGSLGIHRIGLNEASILKVREYCARSVPYIIACADPDFPDDFPYIYRVSPDESPVDIEKIIEFAQTVNADMDHPQKMRAYALEHLDWSVKMKKLKAFLETLVGEPKSIA